MYLPLLCPGHIASIPLQYLDPFRSSLPVGWEFSLVRPETNEASQRKLDHHRLHRNSPPPSHLSYVLKIRHLHAPLRNELHACGHLLCHGPHPMA
jgi:hypothetical protein